MPDLFERAERVHLRILVLVSKVSLGSAARKCYWSMEQSEEQSEEQVYLRDAIIEHNHRPLVIIPIRNTYPVARTVRASSSLGRAAGHVLRYGCYRFGRLDGADRPCIFTARAERLRVETSTFWICVSFIFDAEVRSASPGEGRTCQSA